MHILCMDGFDPCINLAAEEYILKHSSGDVLLLWQNDRTVVVGRYQNTLEEVNQEYALTHGITVVRRNTGGGCVYHDLGNLNYSFITDADTPEELTIESFTQPVVDALRSLGIPAVLTGRNDILADEKKVSGCAQTIQGNRILHHGTLLFSSRLEDVAAVLQVRPEKFQSKSTKSVRSRVGNISEFLSIPMTVLQFRDYLASWFGGEELSLNEAQWDEIRSLAESKYRSWEWTYGESPKFHFHNRQRFSGGTVEVGASVEDGYIIDIALRGDFLARRSVAEIEQALRGQPLRQDALLRLLKGFELQDYFGTITAEELTQCLLSICV